MRLSVVSGKEDSAAEFRHLNMDVYDYFTGSVSLILLMRRSYFNLKARWFAL